MSGWLYDCYESGMQDVIRARLSTPVSEPELSKMWASERTTFTTGSGDGIDTFLTAPELVIEGQGCDVSLRYPGDADPDHARVKQAFERAVRRYKPSVEIEWAA